MNPKSIMGYSDTETVKLDFDDTDFKTARYWASRAMHRFKLEGFLILKSSKNNYHVVFNRRVSWSENMKIVAWVSLLSHSETLLKWLRMQCIKESSTLRVSCKGSKPSPRIVYRYGEEGGEIRYFLQFRKLIKNMRRKLRLEFVNA